MDIEHAVNRGLAAMQRLGLKPIAFDGPQIEPRGVGVVWEAHTQDVDGQASDDTSLSRGLGDRTATQDEG